MEPFDVDVLTCPQLNLSGGRQLDHAIVVLK